MQVRTKMFYILKFKSKSSDLRQIEGIKFELMQL